MKIHHYIFEDVWERIRSVTGWKKYGEFADFLEIKAASVSGAKKRGGMPIEWAFRVARDYNVSTDWLLTGEELNSPFDLDLLEHVAQVFERIYEHKGLDLGWNTKGKLLRMIFENVLTLGFVPDSEGINKITNDYLRLIELGAIKKEGDSQF